MSENRTPVAESQRTIGQLVADATHDVQGLVKSEIALAKAKHSSFFFMIRLLYRC